MVVDFEVYNKCRDVNWGFIFLFSLWYLLMNDICLRFVLNVVYV